VFEYFKVIVKAVVTVWWGFVRRGWNEGVFEEQSILEERPSSVVVRHQHGLFVLRRNCCLRPIMSQE
jgi:hypothetical protein